nr:LysR substrate-binding domain-containing protein [uncultured Roseococcus sp.]
MDLKQLRSFLAVAEEGNFARAAHRLNIAAPPLTRRIQELEAEIGAALFLRTTRHVELTPAGRALQEALPAVFAALDEGIRAARRHARGDAGTLAIGYTGHASAHSLPRLIRAFRQSRPEVRVDIHGPGVQGDLLKELRSRRLDAALCFLPVEGDDLECRDFVESELAIVLSDLHPLAQAANLTVADLAGEPFVALPRDQGFYLRKAMDLECRHAGFIPNIVEESTEPKTLLCLVAGGTGVAIMPRQDERLEFQGVVFRPLPPDRPGLRHGLVWRKSAENPALAPLLAVAESL